LRILTTDSTTNTAKRGFWRVPLFGDMTGVGFFCILNLSRGEVPGFKHDKSLGVARGCGPFCFLGGGVRTRKTRRAAWAWAGLEICFGDELKQGGEEDELEGGEGEQAV